MLDSSALPQEDSKRYERFDLVLKSHTVDETGPGSILRDFEFVLARIGEDGIPVGSSSRGFFPDKVTEEIDAHLGRVPQRDIKRFRQPTCSHVHGLYLILRTSRIGVIKGKGKVRRIALDTEMLKAYRELNSTEKYFNLFDAWMEGHPDIIGENSRLWYKSHLHDCAAFLVELKRLPFRQGEQFPVLDYVRYNLGFYNLALMELFGLVDVEQGKPVVGEIWPIRGIRGTEYGQALLSALRPGLGAMLALAAGAKFELGPEDGEDAEDEYEDKGRLPWDESEVENDDETLPPLIEVWQKLLNPYYPEWRTNLALTSPQFRAGTYMLKVSVAKAWRRFAVQGDVYLECLAGSILNAFEFDFDHLYMFTYKTKLGIACSVHHTFMQEPPYVDEVRIGDMELDEGDKFDFIFDFGDNWRFKIKVERITEAEPAADRKALLIKAKGEAPHQYNGACWG